MLSDKKIEDIFDYFFLLVGLFFIISLFFPYPILFIAEYMNFEQFFGDFSYNCLLSICITFFALIIIQKINPEIAKKIVMDGARLSQSIFLTIAVGGVLFVITAIFKPPLMWKNSMVGIVSLIFGVFFIISFIVKKWDLKILKL